MSLDDAARDGQADAEAAGLGAAGGVGAVKEAAERRRVERVALIFRADDDAVTITDGTLDISKCYEGIEGQTIDISGGTIVAAGYSGMAQNFGSDSTQGSTCTVTMGGQSTNVTLESLIYGSGGMGGGMGGQPGGGMGTPPDGTGGGSMGTPPDGTGGSSMGTPPDGNNGSNMGTPPDGGKGGRPGQ